MEWSENYMIGVKEIDDQHQEIFRRIQWLVDSADNVDLEEMLGFIERYISHHFDDEEKIMIMMDYVGLKDHQMIHHAFKRDMAERINELNNTEDNLLKTTRKVELAGHLAGWLLEHIMTEDFKLAAAVEQFARLALVDVKPKYLPKERSDARRERRSEVE